MAGEQLRVTEGKERGTLLSVEADLLIGRSAPEGEGRLGGDPEISRRHARISRGSDRQLEIEDLGSANGTFVNDERIDAPRALTVGDLIRMGKTVLQVTVGPRAVPQGSRLAPEAPGAVPERSPLAPEAPGAVPERSPLGSEAPAVAPASASEAAGDVLLVTAGTTQGRRFTLRDELVIGRGVSGEGRLSEDLELSRRHARIAREPGGQLIVEDLGSANGTFVNGERLRGRQVLRVGDSLQVGSTTLQLTDGGRASAPPAAAAAAPPPAAVPVAPPPAAAPVAPPPAAAPVAPVPVARAKRPQIPAVPAADLAGLPPALRMGSVFAGCRVEQVIGHGDMGIVYQAEELALQRPVALKLIVPEYSRDERFRERFRRESKIAAAIDHPNVIPVFDAGDENGVLYIMMRLVEGTDLRALIAAEGGLGPLRAARIVRQVGAALDAAHARGMLHRDVKPSNVLLARRDHVYLSDFGLAKPADSEGGLTRHGTIVARAEYVAPEQILNQRVDARADVYALGCLLFEALTGEAPFARGTEGPGALAHLDAPRPSPRALRPDLPREFDDVVRRAMATDPSDRYPSAGDLGQAALVAAGGQRRANPWSVVATGEAAPVVDEPAAHPVPSDGALAPVRQDAPADRHDPLRWVIALAFLVIVAVGMVGALKGISTL